MLAGGQMLRCTQHDTPDLVVKFHHRSLWFNEGLTGGYGDRLVRARVWHVPDLFAV